MKRISPLISAFVLAAILLASCKPQEPPATVPPGDVSDGASLQTTSSPTESVRSPSESGATESDTDTEISSPETEPKEHVHTYSKAVESPEYLVFANDGSCTAYLYSCECGARGSETFEPSEPHGHMGGSATCTKRAICEVCGREYGDMAEHVFDREVREEKYLAKDVKCSHEATFKKSCACGAASDSETFSTVYDSHTYQNEVCTVCNKSYYTDGLIYEHIGSPSYYSVTGPGTAKDERIIRIPATYNGLPILSIVKGGLAYCENLEELILSEPMKSINTDALLGTDNIKYITLSKNTITSPEITNKEKIVIVTVIGNDDIKSSFPDFCSPLLETVQLTDITPKIRGYSLNGLNIRYLIIPEGTTEIDTYSLSTCKNLSYLELPSTLKTIREKAFGLSAFKDITLPLSVTSFEGALDGCEQLEHCTIPVSNIDTSTIYNKRQEFIRKIFGKGIKYETVYENGRQTVKVYDALPDSINLYGNECLTSEIFLGCDDLRKLTIDPTSGLTMEAGALLNCKNLESLTLNYGIIPKNKQGNIHFCSTFGFVNEQYNIHGIPKTLKEVYIVGSDTIPDHFFDGCAYIEKIVITGNVKEIGAYAFNGCVNLKEIVLPDSVEVIGEGAFLGCSSLERIVLPSSLKEIGKLAFARTSLIYVDFPDSVQVIGTRSFEICTRLVAVDLPISVQEIGAYAFFDCSSLKRIIYEGDADWMFYPIDTEVGSLIPRNTVSMPTRLASELMYKLTHGRCVAVN